MKLLICSDIHGDLEGARAALAAMEREGCEKLLLLGDILYHGPRNDLPSSYAPKAVIDLLNGARERILAVRGNCDTEVDQMVLAFPILADYAVLSLDGLTLYATHGHRYSVSSPMPMAKGDILLHGHTHLYALEVLPSGITYINPGSVSLPKGGNPKTYAVYERRCITVKTTDGTPLLEARL